MPSQVYGALEERRPWYITPKTDVPGMMGYDNVLRAEGFDGDGDHVDLPAGGVGSLTYYNNAHSQQWSKTTANIAAAADNYCGVMYDLTDDLIYVLVCDTATTPVTYHLASVNKAGTVVNIGNDQPTTDFSTHIPDVGYQNVFFGRSADGVGNFIVRSASSGNGEEMEINYSTGAIVGDVSEINSLGDITTGSEPPTYRTPNGTFVGGWNGSTTAAYVNLQGIGVENSDLGGIRLQPDCGLGWASSMNIVQWKGYITAIRFTTATAVVMGNRFFETAEFDNAFDILARQLGLVA